MIVILIIILLIIQLLLIYKIKNIYGYGSVAFVSSAILFMCFGFRPLMIYFDDYVIANHTEIGERVFYYSFALSAFCLILFYGSLLINIKKLKVEKIQNIPVNISISNRTTIYILILYLITHIVGVSRLDDVNQLTDIHAARNRADNIIYMGLAYTKELLLLIMLISFNKLKKITKIISLLVIAIVISREVLFFASKNTIFSLVFLLLLVFRINNLKIRYTHFVIFSALLLLAFIFSEFARYIFVNPEILAKFTDGLTVGVIELLSASINTLLTRFHGFDSISTVVRDGGVLSMPFLTFEVVARALLPRFLNPEKGDVALSVWFGDQFWGAANTGIAFWPPTEFALSFGYFAPLAMIMLAKYIKIFEKMLFPLNWWNIFMYSAFYNSFRLMEYTFATSLTAYIMNLVFAAFLYFLIRLMSKIKDQNHI